MQDDILLKGQIDLEGYYFSFSFSFFNTGALKVNIKADKIEHTFSIDKPIKKYALNFFYSSQVLNSKALTCIQTIIENGITLYLYEIKISSLIITAPHDYIKEIMFKQAFKGSKYEVAMLLDMRYSKFMRIIKGHQLFDLDFLFKFCKLYELNPSDLLNILHNYQTYLFLKGEKP